jgi:L-malate glycosyltransferase
VQVHQVLAGAAPGDAITGEALALQRALQTLGPSEVFAQHRDSDVLDRVRHISEYDSVVHGGADRVLLLVHMSISEPAVARFLETRSESLLVRYHNVTPAHFFEPYDPAFAVLLARGRDDLAALRDRAVAAVADSRYNESELREIGYRETSVIPLRITVDKLLAAHPEWPAHVPTAGPEVSPVLLFVGRVAPNKRQEHCLAALHVLQTYHAPRARMYFIGGGEVRGYRAMLDRGAAELGLDRVFTGRVSDGALSALYRRADVFLCMSEHEGFCAPLLESMAFGLPVVALARAAVPDTLGDAGLLLDEPDPQLAAAAVCRVVEDRALRDTLVARGRERLHEFAPEKVDAAFLALVRSL